MIIIVEGIDRVGKTTLCHKIHEELNIPIFKIDRVECALSLTPYEKTILNVGHAHGLIDAWNMSNEDLIVDRFYWTEYVYTKIQRYRAISYKLVREIEDHMFEHIDNYFIVHIRPTDINWSSDAHGSDLSKHLELFDKIYDDSRLHKIRADYISLDYAASKIKERLHEKCSL